MPGSIWHASNPSVDIVLQISHIFIVVEQDLNDLKYISFESRPKWKNKVLTDEYLRQEEPMNC
jgi:hypothetical protein